MLRAVFTGNLSWPNVPRPPRSGWRETSGADRRAPCARNWIRASRRSSPISELVGLCQEGGWPYTQPLRQREHRQRTRVSLTAFCFADIVGAEASARRQLLLSQFRFKPKAANSCPERDEIRMFLHSETRRRDRVNAPPTIVVFFVIPF